MSQTTSDTNELPFRIWHNLARAFYRGQHGAEQIARTITGNTDAVVHVIRDENGQLGNTICLWSSEAYARTCDLRTPSYVLTGRPLKKWHFTPVPVRDVLATKELLEALRDRLGSLVLYDPQPLPAFPDWTWSFSGASACNLLIENDRLVLPPHWDVQGGKIAQLEAKMGCVRIIDSDGRMGLMSDAGEVTVRCSLAYISRPRCCKNTAFEAATHTMPEPWEPCDLVDIDGERINPAGIRIRAGTLWHGIAVVHPGDNRLTGFMTSTGELFARRLWKEVRMFSEDRAAVQDPATGLWGYLDDRGSVAISPRFTLARSFDRGHAVVSTPDSGGLLGLINANGDIVIEPVWSKLDWFLGKYFLVSDGEALGLIDNQGNTIIELYYPTREEDAEIEKARGSIRSHPFVRMLGEQLKEKIAAIAPGGSLAPLTGVLSASWAGDIELTAAGLWGRKVELMADYRPEYMGRPIEAGSTGSISFYYPVTASIFDLSKEAPVLGLSILPHASIGVPWELLRFASEPVSTTVTSSPDTP